MDIVKRQQELTQKAQQLSSMIANMERDLEQLQAEHDRTFGALNLVNELVQEQKAELDKKMAAGEKRENGRESYEPPSKGGNPSETENATSKPTGSSEAQDFADPIMVKTAEGGVVPMPGGVKR